MSQLTALERALLEQFRRLAKEFDQSQSASATYSKKVAEWSRSISQRQSAIEARLSQIEATQQRLSTGLENLNAALAKQTASTTHLVQQVNALLSKRAK